MNQSELSISNQVAIIIGASRGIGAATAKTLAAEGRAVVLAAREASSCQAIVEEIEQAGGIAETAACDATDYLAVKHLIDSVYKRHQRIDILINNAGILEPVEHIAKCDPAAWANAITLNLVGAFNGCRAVLPIFERTGHGVIINLSTGAAEHPIEGWSAYCASKAGLAMFTRTLALETSESNIRVYGFRPGMVNTIMTREALKVKINRISELNPEEFSDPSVPAKAITWLCCKQPDDLSGAEIEIDDPDFRERAGL